MTPFIAEIIGTAILILLGGGVVANVVLNKTIGNNSGWIVITTGWALAVYVAVVIVGPHSGAHINPAVTLALAVAGKFPWADVPMYILAQMIGAMIGSTCVWAMYKLHFNETEDADTKKAVFCTAPAIRPAGAAASPAASRAAAAAAPPPAAAAPALLPPPLLFFSCFRFCAFAAALAAERAREAAMRA